MLRVELQRLSHKDVRQRRMAVRRLFEIGDAAALPAFVDLLDDDDPWFADKAVEAIRHWLGSEHRSVVVSLSVSDESPIRQLAAELAPRLGTPGLDVLSNLCLDDDDGVRRTAWKGRLRIDLGSIPVAFKHEDHVVRRMAVERSGDSALLSEALEDEHLRVRGSALDRMAVLGLESDALDSLLDDANLRAKAAELRLPALIEGSDTATLSSLCSAPDAALRKVLAKHLDQADWFGWTDVVESIQQSEDVMLMPRLLRSRREPEAETLRLTLLSSAESMVRARVLEHMHGRPLSDSARSAVTSLCEDEDPLIAQAAASVLSDATTLGADT